MDFLNKLNNFFGRFRAEKAVPNQGEKLICLDTSDVQKTLKRVNMRKALGPNTIPGWVLRGCADQLACDLTDNFNTSLDQAKVPSRFKTASIIPVLKKLLIPLLNDFRPIPLTPIMVKCFERPVEEHIASSPLPTFDPFQFACQPNCSTEDAVSSTLHLSLSHQEETTTHVQMLFLEFSSASFHSIRQSYTRLCPKSCHQPHCEE